MMFLVWLLLWVLILGAVFALARYAIGQWPAAQPFKGIAMAILCVIAIVVLIGLATGQIPVAPFGYHHLR